MWEKQALGKQGMYRKQENNYPEQRDHTALNILVLPPQSKLYSTYILVCQETQDVNCNFQVAYTDHYALSLIDFKPASKLKAYIYESGLPWWLSGKEFTWMWKSYDSTPERSRMYVFKSNFRIFR